MTTHKNVTHLGKRDFVCPECNKAFGYKHLLQRHTAKVHSLDDSSSDEDDQGNTTVEEDESFAHIDQITGKTYATRARSNIALGKSSRCPFPDLGDLVQQFASTSSSQPCTYVYSRLYDLRRHLDSTHGVQIGKEELRRWVAKKAPLVEGTDD